MRENIVRSQYPNTNPTGNDPFRAVASSLLCDRAEVPYLCHQQDCGTEQMDMGVHPLFVTCGGSSLLLHFCGESFDDV
jgi:hypothetical protein